MEKFDPANSDMQEYVEQQKRTVAANRGHATSAYSLASLSESVPLPTLGESQREDSYAQASERLQSSVLGRSSAYELKERFAPARKAFRVVVDLKEIKICGDCINVDLCAEFQIRKFDAV